MIFEKDKNGDTIHYGNLAPEYIIDFCPFFGGFCVRMCQLLVSPVWSDIA